MICCFSLYNQQHCLTLAQYGTTLWPYCEGNNEDISSLCSSNVQRPLNIKSPIFSFVLRSSWCSQHSQSPRGDGKHRAHLLAWAKGQWKPDPGLLDREEGGEQQTLDQSQPSPPQLSRGEGDWPDGGLDLHLQGLCWESGWPWALQWSNRSHCCDGWNPWVF